MVFMKDFVDAYASERSIPKSQATQEINVFLSILKKLLKEKGGVTFRGIMTLKTYTKKGRSGSINGKKYNTPEKVGVKLIVGKNFEEELNS